MAQSAGTGRSGTSGIELSAVGLEAARLLSVLHHAAFLGREPWDETAIGQILALQGVEAWLACVQGSSSEQGMVPVGFIISRYVMDEGEILSLGVHPDWQRRGIARSLLAHVVKRAQQNKATLFLEVRFSNEAAFGLYGQFGFQQVAVRRRYYEDGEDARLLRWSPG
ncbi:ribosomal protein S18-alanine N-acetyltransferase [Bombella intestini]|uniref:ribosomal protein S18-alanine N-acetyltransferase n=1 Tax=Bombella intestini TaxID=1539051 RepID=UPI00130147E4|nr:ribosomal protein S18-alanine N-acetyltransferase [Bombella intestini]